MALSDLAIRARPPERIGRYLLDSETLVVAVRRHPARVAEPVLSTVAGLVVALWVGSEVPADVPFVVDVVWFAWFLVAARAVWLLLWWRQDWFVATDRRLLLTYGILTRKVAMMPLIKVTDLSYNRSPMGRVLGYGQFVLESAGQDQAMRNVDWLPNPDLLYRRICAEIFEGPARHRLALGAGMPLVPGGTGLPPVAGGPLRGRRPSPASATGAQPTERIARYPDQQRDEDDPSDD